MSESTNADAQQNFRCKLCGQVFQSDGKLRAHTEEQHFTSESVTPEHEQSRDA